jgi:stress response protein SCP2
MSVSLSKGQKINLSKEQAGLSQVMVGLGWDEVEKNQGFLATLFGGKPMDIDCDAFAIMLAANGKVLNAPLRDIKQCTVFYNNLSDPSKSIVHQGDNLTGAGEGDDEQIFVDLNRVPADVFSIVFAVNIYEAFNRNQHFGMLRNAFIRVVDAKSGRELCRFDLNENYNNETALIAGALRRTDAGWEFVTDGSHSRVKSLVEVVQSFA